MWWRQLLAQGRTDTLSWVGSSEAPLARTDQSLVGPLHLGRSAKIGEVYMHEKNEDMHDMIL